MFNKSTQTKPVAKTNKRNKTKGGSQWFWETDHCLACDKINSNKGFEKQYNPSILDTGFLDFNNAKPYSIYNLDTSLTDYTSRIGYI